jgi:hypothetical protein
VSKIVVRKFLRNFSGTSPDYQAEWSVENFCGRIALQARADSDPYQLPTEGTAIKKGRYCYRPLDVDY